MKSKKLFIINLVNIFGGNHMSNGFVCKCCLKYHKELPMSYGSAVPDYFFDIPDDEQESRVEMNND